MPSYRFGALVVAYMKYDKMPEDLEKIDESLEETDRHPHAFFSSTFITMVKTVGGILSNSPKSSTIIDNVVYDTRFVDELPVEERKRQEARAAGKPFRVPEWWRGEKANYKIAKNMMGTLPKKMGPVKD